MLRTCALISGTALGPLTITTLQHALLLHRAATALTVAAIDVHNSESAPFRHRVPLLRQRAHRALQVGDFLRGGRGGVLHAGMVPRTRPACSAPFAAPHFHPSGAAGGQPHPHGRCALWAPAHAEIKTVQTDAVRVRVCACAYVCVLVCACARVVGWGRVHTGILVPGTPATCPPIEVRARVGAATEPALTFSAARSASPAALVASLTTRNAHETRRTKHRARRRRLDLRSGKRLGGARRVGHGRPGGEYTRRAREGHVSGAVRNRTRQRRTQLRTHEAAVTPPAAGTRLRARAFPPTRCARLPRRRWCEGDPLHQPPGTPRCVNTGCAKRGPPRRAHLQQQSGGPACGVEVSPQRPALLGLARRT